MKTMYIVSFTFNKRLPAVRGQSGVVIKYRMSCYDQIGRQRVDSCSMGQRRQILDSLKLTDDHRLVSDIFCVGMYHFLITYKQWPSGLIITP